MTWIARLATLSILSIALATLCSAQVATGTPPFSSFGGGPFDVVNLGNLNVHFTVPIINKKGRRNNFTYAVTYDNSLYYPVTSSGITTWQPVTNYGWNAVSSVDGATLGFIGYVTNGQVVASGSAPCNPPQDYSPCPYYVYAAYQYVDNHGTPHWLNLKYISNSGHEGPQPPGWSGDGTTNDGSGFRYDPNSATVYDKADIPTPLVPAYPVPTRTRMAM